jgi:hypothetical protein
LGKVDHNASRKPLAGSQHDLGSDTDGSAEPTVFNEIAPRYVDEEVGPESHRVNRCPEEIMESSQGCRADQAYGPLVMVHDLRLALDGDATSEHIADRLVAGRLISTESAPIRQLDDRHRVTKVPAEHEQIRHPAKATGVLPAAQLPVCVPHRPQPVTNQSALLDLHGRQLFAEQ